MPKLSFVIPYYRKLNSIGKCLTALYAQSIKDFEVIVVKDGPDGDVDRILKKFLKKKGMKVIEIEHGGACKARNAGAKEATGEFISFWDADSYIEPGAAAVWLQAFELHPEMDFVYAGYRFPEGYGGIASQPFNAEDLRVCNYISGHFPIRREKAPRWDESLKSLQDWDFWLSAIGKGLKGFYLRGFSFKTDLPGADSISGIGCTDENWLDRRNAVKAKHGLPNRRMAVISLDDEEEGKRLAEVLDADFTNFLTTRPHDYSTIVQVGFDPQKADINAKMFNDPKNKVKKILFWRGSDLQTLWHYTSPAVVEALVTTLNRSMHFQFCEDKVTRDLLQKAGFKAVIFPLPMKSEGELSVSLPAEFKVVVDCAQEFGTFFQAIEKAMPDIRCSPFKGAMNTDEISVFVQFLNEKSVNSIVKKVLLNGRFVISNIQAPYCGFVSDNQPLEVIRTQLIRRIREVQERGVINSDGRAYYAGVSSPDKFKAAFNAVVHPPIVHPKREAVAA